MATEPNYWTGIVWCNVFVEVPTIISEGQKGQGRLSIFEAQQSAIDHVRAWVPVPSDTEGLDVDAIIVKLKTAFPIDIHDNCKDDQAAKNLAVKSLEAAYSRHRRRLISRPRVTLVDIEADWIEKYW